MNMNDTFTYNWLIHTWHDAFTCDLTHSQDSFMCDMSHWKLTWRIDEIYVPFAILIHTATSFTDVTSFIYFICTFVINMHIFMDILHMLFIDILHTLFIDILQCLLIDILHMLLVDILHILFIDILQCLLIDILHILFIDILHILLIDILHILFTDILHGLFRDILHIRYSYAQRIHSHALRLPYWFICTTLFKNAILFIYFIYAPLLIYSMRAILFVCGTHLFMSATFAICHHMYRVVWIPIVPRL